MSAHKEKNQPPQCTAIGTILRRSKYGKVPLRSFLIGVQSQLQPITVQSTRSLSNAFPMTIDMEREDHPMHSEDIMAMQWISTQCDC